MDALTYAIVDGGDRWGNVDRWASGRRDVDRGAELGVFMMGGGECVVRIGCDGGRFCARGG